MLTLDQLTHVYTLLDQDMVEGNCGQGSCEAMCCTPTAVKYLLPGEEAYFRQHHPEVELDERPWLTEIMHTQCICERAHRTFCCRAFPFRPALHPETGEVVDLVKVDNPNFSACWIDRPNSAWRQRAIQAWQIVLGDADCRKFYSQIQYLKGIIETIGNDVYQCLSREDINVLFENALDMLLPEEEDTLYREFFPKADMPAPAADPELVTLPKRVPSVA